MKIKFQQQSEHSECGLACVTMLIDYWNGGVSLSETRERYGVPNGGYNLAQMQFVLEQSGLNSKAVNIKARSIKAVPTPFIAFWKNKHFIIVEKVSSKYVSVIDPAKGRVKLSYSDFEKDYSDISMYITNDLKKRCELPKINKILKKLIKNNYKLFTKTFFIFLIAQFISIYIPFVIRWIIDGGEKDIGKVTFYTLLLMFSYFVMNIFRIRMITKLQTITDKKLLSKTIIRLLDLPYSYFTNRSNGELIYRINSNIYIRQILIDQVISTVVDLCFFMFYLLVMFSFNRLLTLVTLLVTIVIIFFSVINTKILKKITQNEMVVLTNSQGLINEMVSNVFTIKATNSQKHMYEKWKENYEKQINYEKEKAKYNSIFANIPQMIQAFYALLIYVCGYYLVLKGQTTIGSLVAFSTIGMSFLTPITTILNSYTQFQTVQVYLDRLLDILQTKKESSFFGEKKLENFDGSVILDNVSYKYSMLSEEVIKDISLNISGSSKIAIVGASGSGKSTLLKVAAGLYQSTSGNILYGNKDIQFLDIHKLREKIGIVLQENVLFNGTFKENITMGRNYSDEEIIETLKIVDLYNYILTFPLGLETQISELGQNMSGGQRQKVSIARTIISKPKIIFLDEPTSSLDNISESIIMNYLFSLKSTLVIVAHRLETIKNFDQIVVLDKGKIVGIGKHSVLLKTNSVYQNLYKGS
ncbi:peptidase domain-containing ABC transporter [Enterococcus faecalis]|jgi:ABC-type bacteriocin/lantibiotic exporter with double-glycine peptidase domain